MKKGFSLLIAFIMIISVFANGSFSVGATAETDRITEQIKTTYSKALSLRGWSSFKKQCDDCVKYQLMALGITSSSDTDVRGNGNAMYGNITAGKTSTGYTKTKYSGNNCLYNIINANAGNVYNVVVSWTHQNGASNSNPGAGHVLFIHAIINNTVYFADNYTYSNTPEGSPLIMSLSNFMTKWNVMYGNAIGAVHFTKTGGDDVTDTNDYMSPDNYTYPDPNTTGTFYYTSPTMKDGNGNTYVSWIQAVLYQLGYSIEIDGSYGQKTEATVRQFQSDKGLEVDGRVGPATKRKLLELWNAKKVENSHTCDKKTSSYQASHPHYLVYKCSVCGKEQVDTTITQRMDSCNSCLPEKSVLTVVPGTGTEQTIFTWKAAGGADCYELKIFEAGDDTPLHWLFNLTTTQYELLLPPGDYVGYVVSLNIDLIDTSNYFVYSDRVEFSVLEDEVLIPFASVEYNGNRYELFDVTMNWTEAKSKCAELGGHLVTISSEEEMDKIMSIVSVGEMATYWIGYSDEDTEDYWCSVTGEEITYTNWDVGQPDDYNNAEDYALIKNQPNGKWNDVKNEYSDVPVGFICEYEDVADEDNPTDSTEPSTGGQDIPTDPTNPVVLGLLGDANGDEKVNIKDATLIQKTIANLTILSEIGEMLADADLNTKINIKDATAIQKHIAGIETGYPIGKAKTK